MNGWELLRHVVRKITVPRRWTLAAVGGGRVGWTTGQASMSQRVQSHRMSALPTVGAWTEAVETAVRAHAAFLHRQEKIDFNEAI